MPPKRKRKEKVWTFHVHPRHLVKLVTRLTLMVVLVVAFMFLVRGLKELTATVVGVKFMEVLTDVLADRLFPSVGGEL